MADRDYPVLLNTLLQGHPTGNLAPYFKYVMTKEGPGEKITHIATATFRDVAYGVGKGSTIGAAKGVAAKVVYERFSTSGVPGT